MNTSNFLSIPAMMFPDQKILIFKGHFDEDLELTYAELLDRTNRLGNALRDYGVERGDKVAVLQTNSNQYVEAHYATAKLGATFVPLNYRAKRDELLYMLTTSQAKILLVGDRYLDVALDVKRELPMLRYLIGMEQGSGGVRGEGVMSYEALVKASSPDEIDTDVDDDEVAILMFTSGTTSLPKGVLLSHGDFTNLVFETVEPADGTDRGKALLSVPLYHVAGITTIMTSLFGGRQLVILPQFDPREWLHAVSNHKITHAFLVPTMLKRVLDDEEFMFHEISSLQILSYGAAPMPLPVLRRAIDVFPNTVGFINAFGQTESTSTVTMLTPEDHRLEGTPEEVEKKLRRLTSIGKPLPGVELKIFDEVGNEVPAGQIGEIAIFSNRAMKGYVGQEEATRQTLSEGWLRTRDLGWVDEDGYVFLAGRKGDMIIRGGENIAPEEVESVLYSHPAVEEAAVVGVPDEEWGERVMAFIALKPGHTATEADLIEYCRQRLASFKKPEIIRFIPELPRNALGKVLRKDLRARI
ncbi:MAG: long-chain-fatty-acid--CoA ligase [Chloroflexi bacterium]|nr:long-chain-fatty-acid--CoA ligase [Chloroflexota bacterium]